MKRLVVIAVALFAVPLHAAEPATTGTPVVGVGIVSADHKWVFVPAKDGGIEALDLATGKPGWTNKDASQLAGASDKVVLAWLADKGNAFRVVAIDAATGKTIGKSDSVKLPDWATTAKTWGRTFRTAAKADGEGAIVYWNAGAFYSGGAAPPPEVEAAARKNESGMAKIDFKTGKVVPANGKPKDTDFAFGPGAGGTNKVGDYEFQMTEEIPGFKPGAPRLTKVTLTMVKDKKELWKRELAGNPWSPPPP